MTAFGKGGHCLWNAVLSRRRRRGPSAGVYPFDERAAMDVAVRQVLEATRPWSTTPARPLGRGMVRICQGEVRIMRYVSL